MYKYYIALLVVVFSSCARQSMLKSDVKQENSKEEIAEGIDTIYFSCEEFSKFYVQLKGDNNFKQGGWSELVTCLSKKSFDGDALAIEQLINIYDYLPDHLFGLYLPRYRLRGQRFYDFLWNNLYRFDCIESAFGHGHGGGYDDYPLSMEIIIRLLEMSKTKDGRPAIEYFNAELSKDTRLVTSNNEDDNCWTAKGDQYVSLYKEFLKQNVFVLKDFGEE